MKNRVAVLVGSLRSRSFSRGVARALVARAPKTLACELVEIGDLPLYNEDLESDAPPVPWLRFRAVLAEVDGILFVTPEYNRSIPGGLKNAIDVGSRPMGQSVFTGVPTGVVSVTPHKLGGFGANHALRQAFVFLDMPCMQQPEAYISNAADIVDEDGNVENADIAKLFDNFMSSFENWIAAIRRAREMTLSDSRTRGLPRDDSAGRGTPADRKRATRSTGT